ncbi:MAG: rhomboid family intramembrane serine protease [Bacteroidota bacterium]
MEVLTTVTKNIDAKELSPRQMLMLAALSMNDLSWDYCFRDDNNLYAKAHMGLFSWGESIHVQVSEEQLIINCGQPFWKYFRPKKPQENIDELLSYIQYNRQIYSPEALDEEIAIVQAGKTMTLSATEKIVTGKNLPTATAIIIACNLLYFLVFSFSTASFFNPSIIDIFHWGGNLRLYTFGGEGWRLITSCFLHLGIFHLLGNMFVLFFIGRYLEPVINPYLFTLVYLSTGVLGSVTSVIETGNRVSAGASGAIFGLYGVFIALLTTKMITGEIKRVLFQSIILFAAYGLFTGMSEGVDNAAHLGGLLSGFVFGYIIIVGYNAQQKRMIAGIAIIVLTTGLGFFSLTFFHNDTIQYERMLKRMQLYEHKALAERTDMKLKPIYQQLEGLTNGARANWKLFIKTADSASQFTFGRNKIYPVQKGLLLRYGQDRLAENEIWIRSLKTGDEMRDTKDSIRLLVYAKQDSLALLRQKVLK